MLKRTFLAFAFSVVSGCTYSPEIISASAQNDGESVTVVVRISRETAKKIRDGQYYFSIVTFNCSDVSGRYPAPPFVGGDSATEFEFNLGDGATVDLRGQIPENIWTTYREPCVMLEGGKFVGSKIKTRPAKISVHRSAAYGPSFHNLALHSIPTTPSSEATGTSIRAFLEQGLNTGALPSSGRQPFVTYDFQIRDHHATYSTDRSTIGPCEPVHPSEARDDMRRG